MQAPHLAVHASRFSASIPLRLLLLILSGLLLIGLPIPVVRAAPPAQEPDTRPAVSGGRTLWSQNCQPCHGPTGKGDGPTVQSIPKPPPDFSDPQIARQLVPTENFEVIKNGRIDNFMPPWSNRLSDAQIWDAVAQVWSLGVTPQDLTAGETLYLAQCAACHGQNGSGNGPEAPAEINDFTDLAAMVRQSQAGLMANYRASNQHARLSGLSEEEIWQALDHIRTFTFAVPQRNGILAGRVVNATTNEPVGNIEVTLHVFQGDAEVETRTAQADDAGNYTFEKLSTDHSTFYVVEGRYQNVVYRSDQPGVFVPDSTETTLDLNVYDTTTSAEAINVTQFHYLVSFSPGAVQVVQIFVVGNGDTRAYIGQNGQTFSFTLPVGATNVNFQDDLGGARFIQTDTGYADTEPVKPGLEGLSIVASYEIPYDGDSLTIEVPLPADVASFNVLMQEMGASLSSEQLEFVESRDVQGDTFSIFSGANLSRGQSLTLNLTHLNDLEFTTQPGAPGAAVPDTLVNQTYLRWVVIGVGGLAVLLAGVIYPLMMRPQLTPQAAQADLDTRRQKLLLTLARLDQVFAAGELNEAVYRRARARYKAELAEMMRD